jgi:hypothetical protein
MAVALFIVSHALLLIAWLPVLRWLVGLEAPGVPLRRSAMRDGLSLRHAPPARPARVREQEQQAAHSGRTRPTPRAVAAEVRKMAAAGLPFRVVMSAMRAYFDTVKKNKNGEGARAAPPSGVGEKKDDKKEAAEGACPKRSKKNRRRRGGNKDARRARRLDRVMRAPSPASENVAVAPATPPPMAEPSGRSYAAHATDEKEDKSAAPEQVPPADIPGIEDAAGVMEAKARRAKAAKLYDTKWCAACREISRIRGRGLPGPPEVKRHASWCVMPRERRTKLGEGNANF